MSIVIIIIAAALLAAIFRRQADRHALRRSIKAAMFTIEGSNIKVTDGDSVTIFGNRCRLAGMDAPEWNQPGGNEATHHLRRLLEGQCRVLQTGVDVYGRALVVIQTPNGWAGDLMVESGHAFAEDESMIAAERRARSAGIGIWRGNPMRPSEWRRL